MPDKRLLLLSNSTDPEGRYLQHAASELRDLFGDGPREILFIPYASVTAPWEGYAKRTREALAPLGYQVTSLHEAPDPAAAVRAAAAIAVGGGNTFHLLRELYAQGLVAALRERVATGVPYMGWSAGAVVACPTMRTTNDMPIVEPPSLAALALVPFQINAHYTTFHPPGFRGETRAERLAEFVAANPGVPVLGLPEGMMVRVRGDDVRLAGAPTSAPTAAVFGVPGVTEAAVAERLAFLEARGPTGAD